MNALATLQAARHRLADLGEHDLARAVAAVVAAMEKPLAPSTTWQATPAPWHIDGDAGVIYAVAPQDNGRVDICQLLHDPTDSADAERCAADASLIQSAHYLRGALYELVGVVQQYEGQRGIVSPQQLAALKALGHSLGAPL